MERLYSVEPLIFLRHQPLGYAQRRRAVRCSVPAEVPPDRITATSSTTPDRPSSTLTQNSSQSHAPGSLIPHCSTKDTSRSRLTPPTRYSTPSKRSVL